MRKSSLVRTQSRPGTCPLEGSVFPQHAVLDRFRSDVPREPQSSYESPTGPPDITAIDLPEDQLLRTYSHSSVWDSKVDPLPPLMQMEGFGRYRRSVHADAAWQQKLFRESTRDLGQLVEKLGDFELAQPNPEIWAKVRSESMSSFASSATSSGRASEAISLKQSGVLVCYGFSPSASSSSKDSIRHLRKNSSLSTTSSGEETRPKDHFPPSMISLQRSQAGKATMPNTDDSGERSTSKEVLSMCLEEGQSDSAIDDDDDEAYEDEDTMELGKILEGTRGIEVADAPAQKVGRVERGPQLQKLQSEHFRGQRIVIERSKTVVRRPTAKATIRRSDLRGRPRHGVIDGKLDTTSKHPLHHVEGPLTEGAAVITSSGGSDEVLFMAERGPNATNMRKSNEDDAQTNHSDSTTHTVSAANTTLGKSSSPPSTRSRSGTAIRFLSGNIPPLALETLAETEKDEVQAAH